MQQSYRTVFALLNDAQFTIIKWNNNRWQHTPLDHHSFVEHYRPTFVAKYSKRFVLTQKNLRFLINHLSLYTTAACCTDAIKRTARRNGLKLSAHQRFSSHSPNSPTYGAAEIVAGVDAQYCCRFAAGCCPPPAVDDYHRWCVYLIFVKTRCHFF